ncbi:MAG: DNA-3-methyladenine glycosylase [Solirubrobacteraceae bacterium]|nr:DNA-3-methyladenine glycosylase [Solirubrobacteraceae bacterium]
MPSAPWTASRSRASSPCRRDDGRARGARILPSAVAEPFAHLRAADPVLARILDEHGAPSVGRDPSRPGPADHYGALVRSIVGQQLSVIAARAIYGRLLEHFGGRTPTPAEVLAADPDAMRTAAGLSRAKTQSLRSLAEHVVSGELELDRLDALPDEEIVSELVAVRGIGEWSAHIFLMFQLERPDVLAVGDLGVRRAVERAYGLPGLPSPAELTALAEPWRPWRTIACRILWRSLDNAPAQPAEPAS